MVHLVVRIIFLHLNTWQANLALVIQTSLLSLFPELLIIIQQWLDVVLCIELGQVVVNLIATGLNLFLRCELNSIVVVKNLVTLPTFLRSVSFHGHADRSLNLHVLELFILRLKSHVNPLMLV